MNPKAPLPEASPAPAREARAPEHAMPLVLMGSVVAVTLAWASLIGWLALWFLVL